MSIELIDKAMSNLTIVIVALVVAYTLTQIFKHCTEADRMRMLYEEYKNSLKKDR